MVFNPKEALAKEMAVEEPDLNLAYAALLLAAHLTGNFDVDSYLARLDHMAQAIRARVPAAAEQERLATLNEFLFEEFGFRGNAQDYYNPNNSFLNKVLELKTGIPISLSVVYLELGWRLGLPLWGAGLPGHFMVGYGPPAEALYVDVFNRGQTLNEADCFTLAHVPASRQQAFKQEFLRPVTKKALLYRMLLNLKLIYAGLENWAAAYKTVDLMLTIRPNEPGELRDRGLLAYRLKRLQAAISDLTEYLFRAPDSPDAARIKQQLRAMEEEYLRLN